MLDIQIFLPSDVLLFLLYPRFVLPPVIRGRRSHIFVRVRNLLLRHLAVDLGPFPFFHHRRLISPNTTISNPLNGLTPDAAHESQ
jgi:hypothetical protein